MLAVRPVSLNVVAVGAATWLPLRNTLYPVTPTLSVEAVQLRFTWLLETAVAVSPAGCDGGVVSVLAVVVADTVALGTDRLPAASTAVML